MTISIHLDIDCHGVATKARTIVSRISSLYGCPYGQTRFQTAVRGFMPLFVLLVPVLVSKLIGV